MSLSFRLTEIEKSIAYSDVKKAFTNRRDAWLKATIDHQGSPHKLADLLLELLDAFTNSCINFLFPKPGGFKEMRESIVRIGTATPKETTAAKALREIITHLEKIAIPPPDEEERPLMGRGRPLELGLGDLGPSLEVGQSCQALDIRMTWCDAEVVGKRTNTETGREEYKMHYDGWKKNWDEWVARDSGRIKIAKSKEGGGGSGEGAEETGSEAGISPRKRGMSSVAAEADAAAAAAAVPTGSASASGGGGGGGSAAAAAAVAPTPSASSATTTTTTTTTTTKPAPSTTKGAVKDPVVKDACRLCPAGHRLVFSAMGSKTEEEEEEDGEGDEMLTCDLCGTPLPPSAARYGCTPCDYDLCEKCGEGGSIIPAGEKYVGYRETIPRRAAATAAAAATAELSSRGNKSSVPSAAEAEEARMQKRLQMALERKAGSGGGGGKKDGAAAAAAKGKGKAKAPPPQEEEEEEEEEEGEDDEGEEEEDGEEEEEEEEGEEEEDEAAESEAHQQYKRGELPKCPDDCYLLEKGEHAASEGDRVIALDVRREWCLGRVTKLRFQRKKNHPRKASKAVTAVRVRFDGWGRKWDEWVLLGVGRVGRPKDPEAYGGAGPPSPVVGEQDAGPPKRKRGRPPKNRIDAQHAAALAEAEEAEHGDEDDDDLNVNSRPSRARRPPSSFAAEQQAGLAAKFAKQEQRKANADAMLAARLSEAKQRRALKRGRGGGDDYEEEEDDEEDSRYGGGGMLRENGAGRPRGSGRGVVPPLAKPPSSRFSLGDHVWAVGPDGRPCQAMVVSKRGTGNKIKLRLLDWGEAYDEWHDNDSFDEQYQQKLNRAFAVVGRGGGAKGGVGGTKLSGLADVPLRELLRKLHLKRDQLKVVIAIAYESSISPEAFLVRFNLSSSQAGLYAGAQIVRAPREDDVQVRGIEINAQGKLVSADPAVRRANGAKLSPVQGTKLHFVSNRPFTDAELDDLIVKIRAGVLDDPPLTTVYARIESVHAALQNIQNVPPASQAAPAPAPPAAQPLAANAAAAAAAAPAAPTAADAPADTATAMETDAVKAEPPPDAPPPLPQQEPAKGTTTTTTEVDGSAVDGSAVDTTSAMDVSDAAAPTTTEGEGAAGA